MNTILPGLIPILFLCAATRPVLLGDAIDAPMERQHAAHFIIGNATRLFCHGDSGMIAP
jgi:hypothetical protein